VTVERLRSPEFWDELLFREDGYGRWGRRKLAAYRQLVEGGEVGETVEDYAASRLALGPPHRRLLNKADGRKKVVFTFAGADELLLKGLNRILQSTTAMDHSRLCHSFQPGRGPRTAYRDIRRIRGLQRMHCLHLDVRDFFNSIPVEPLIASLPATITDDQPLYRLLAATFRDQRVLSGDKVIVETKSYIFTYVIDESPSQLTVKDVDTWVLDPVPGKTGIKPTQALITLTTCQDLFHSPDRAVGFGHLVGTKKK